MSELKFPEVNRLMLSGRLTRDPEHRYASDGTPVTSFDIAFHRRYRGRDGKPAEQTGFVVVMTYARLAEVCAQYLHRGNAVLVEGRLQMREWPGKGGTKQRLEVRADLVHFLEKAPISADAGGETADAGADPPEEGELF